MAVVLSLSLALLTSCGGGAGQAALQAAAPVQPTRVIQISTSPGLFPAFDPSISDYVAAVNGSSIQVSVNASSDTQISVDGQPFRTLAFTTQVGISPGQSFSVVVNASGRSQTYHVRCLPADFPAWTTERTGTPQAEYFVITPNIALNAGDQRHYVIIVDGYGVPLWWFHDTDAPGDALLLANGNVAWASATRIEEHTFEGTLVRAFTVDSSLGGKLDTHELQLLPNGDYLFIADVVRGPVDLIPYGGSATGMVIDNVIEEVTPGGSLVWHWSAMDHIPVSEMDPLWRPKYIGNAPVPDPYHMNSVEPDGNGFVVSLRHLNAMIRIDRMSGSIVWKLGGTPRPESLTFDNDPYGNFGGQHDARLLPDGTLTVHDNGTLRSRSPRAVRYSIDPVQRKAKLVEQVTDPDVPSSNCCGSARKQSGGDWIMSWGSNPVVTELAPAGGRLFRMTFTDPYFSYRAAPIPFGAVTRAALRNGMDAQFPR